MGVTGCFGFLDSRIVTRHGVVSPEGLRLETRNGHRGDELIGFRDASGGLGLRFGGLGLGLGLGFGVLGFGFWVLGFGFLGLGFGVWSLGSGVGGLGFGSSLR